MVKQCVRWKPVKCKSRAGKDVYLGVPEIIDVRYRGTLISEILRMPRKTPILFDDAIRMARTKQSECYMAESFGDEPGQYGWYDLHFVSWISSLGYHIELTGDEFEPFSLSDKVV